VLGVRLAKSVADRRLVQPIRVAHRGARANGDPSRRVAQEPERVRLVQSPIEDSMKKWLVWEEEDGVDSAIEVDASDAEEAATTACETWSGMGNFAGGKIPPKIRCCVSEVGDTVRSPHVVVMVTHDYSIDWYGHQEPKEKNGE
jgi:hypothetical protein